MPEVNKSNLEARIDLSGVATQAAELSTALGVLADPAKLEKEIERRQKLPHAHNQIQDGLYGYLNEQVRYSAMQLGHKCLLLIDEIKSQSPSV